MSESDSEAVARGVEVAVSNWLERWENIMVEDIPRAVENAVHDAVRSWLDRHADELLDRVQP